MQIIDGRLVHSATDLVGFLECRHLADLERAVVERHLEGPVRKDAVLERIAKRGREHEARFLCELRGQGFGVTEIQPLDGVSSSERVTRGRADTLAAIDAGVDVIYQAVLTDGQRLGYADFLRRVERPGGGRGWSYEVWDTKRARHATAPAVLQLTMYSDLLGAMQGRQPEHMHLALGGAEKKPESFRVADFAAYYRLIDRQLSGALRVPDPGLQLPTYPEPVSHCDFCRWRSCCRTRWRTDDDLALVANLDSRQRKVLHDLQITTRRELAKPSRPLPQRPDGVSQDSLVRVQAQAEIQVRGERQGRTIAERIPPERNRQQQIVPDRGLWTLPEPSPGDLFLDLEGDPFFESGPIDGIDYLFGLIEPGRLDQNGEPAFHAIWSIADGTVTPAAERQAFEACIDLIMDRWAADPTLHVYHYAHYEQTAIKRLAGRHATRESEVDQLLRGGVFVDLYRTVRQGVRASVESYSIKKLEPLYGFERSTDLRDAGDSIVEFEAWLDHADDGEQRDDLRDEIEGYNRDDCLSTWRLRDWLEDQRADLVCEVLADGGEPPPRPTVPAPEETQDSEAQQKVQALVEALTAGMPEDPADASKTQRGSWLLAQLLGWHQREHKAMWWRFFTLRDDLDDRERVEESDALGQLHFLRSWNDPRPNASSTIHRFRYPAQDHKFELGDQPRDQDGQSVGTVVRVDDTAGEIDLKVGQTRPPPRPTSLIPLDYVNPKPKPESLQHLAEWVIEHGVDAPGPFRAARDLLLRRPPRAGQVPDEPLAAAGEDPQDAAQRLVLALDQSYLAVQGPPGSGKSTVGAQMIVDLVAAGKRVGVTANSHKVIGELLEKTARAARKRCVRVRIGQKTSRGSAPTFQDAAPLTSNNQTETALRRGSLDVVGGTSWLWASDVMQASVDVLVVDEAGQMSLADTLAAARSATNLVLLGDPQQLDQPLQGSHPPGAERSALAHLLGDKQVMPAHLGLFLDGTWRLHPDICAYTSEIFYAGSLRSHPGREKLNLAGTPPFHSAGLRFLAVPHERCVSDSKEEAAAIAASLQPLFDTDADAAWTNAKGQTQRIERGDVLIITPYNRQIRTLKDEPALRGLRIGTVDKFQGQEAPISIYSMATSSSEDAPRGMEFLYSLNRLNVATSRAQCLALVAASPGLLHVRCQNPTQMRLANALARLVELANACPPAAPRAERRSRDGSSAPSRGILVPEGDRPPRGTLAVS